MNERVSESVSQWGINGLTNACLEWMALAAISHYRPKTMANTAK